jgi:organic hydroperoxide reductase OsmC/OhrA
MGEERVAVDLSLRDGYAFAVDFGLDGVGPLLVDEPPPLGEGAGPSAARLLAAAVGNCMSASLLFCMRKARLEVEGLETHVEASLVRNAQGRTRIGTITVRLTPGVSADDLGRFARCTALFEDFCTVGQSVRQGVDVRVEVVPAAAAAAPG